MPPLLKRRPTTLVEELHGQSAKRAQSNAQNAARNARIKELQGINRRNPLQELQLRSRRVENAIEEEGRLKNQQKAAQPYFGIANVAPEYLNEENDLANENVNAVTIMPSEFNRPPIGNANQGSPYESEKAMKTFNVVTGGRKRQTKRKTKRNSRTYRRRK